MSQSREEENKNGDDSISEMEGSAKAPLAFFLNKAYFNIAADETRSSQSAQSRTFP